MSIDVVHSRTTPDDAPAPQPRIIDVSDLPAVRVREYCREAETAGHDFHLTHRAGRTYLVADH